MVVVTVQVGRVGVAPFRQQRIRHRVLHGILQRRVGGILCRGCRVGLRRRMQRIIRRRSSILAKVRQSTRIHRRSRFRRRQSRGAPRCRRQSRRAPSSIRRQSRGAPRSIRRRVSTSSRPRSQRRALDLQSGSQAKQVCPPPAPTAKSHRPPNHPPAPSRTNICKAGAKEGC